MSYRVLVDDNFHFMDESERYTLGDYPTFAAAVQAAQAIVDDFLVSALEPGLDAQQLYVTYTGFGEDPFILPLGGEPAQPFSAWDYAWQRCQALCPGPSTSRPGRPAPVE